jgi:uncharacterized membrane protein YukC
MAQKSAMGRTVDMSALMNKNEKVRAVGNMNVNARGDVVDSNNKVIQDNTKRVKKAYNRTVNTAQPARNVPQPTPTNEQKITADVVKDITPELTEEEKQFEMDDEDFVKEVAKK